MNKKLFSLSFVMVMLLILMVLFIKKISIASQIIYFSFLLLEITLVVYSVILKKSRFLIVGFALIITTTLFEIKITMLANEENRIYHAISTSNMEMGYIAEFPYHKKNHLYFPMNVIAIKTKMRSDYFKIKPFKVLIKIDSTKNKYRKGDLIKIEKKISFPQKKIGSFNYRNYLLHHTIYGLIYTKEFSVKIINPKIQRNIANITIENLQKTIWKFRGSLLQKLKNHLSKNGYSFILSIFFGIRNELDPHIYKEFQNTGMTHLLAISGLHIGFIGMLFFDLFHLFLSKSKSYLFSTIILFLYILLIVPSGSSLRAFLMFVLLGFFFMLGMKTLGITLLSFSGIILIFVNPYFVFDLGFQFSFLATFSILMFSKEIENRLPRIIPNKIKSLFSVTIAAFISLLFLQWALFNKLAIFSMISSPVVVFLFGILFSVLFFAIIAFYFTNFIFIAKIMDFLIFIFLKIISFLNVIPAIKLPQISLYLGYSVFPIFLGFFVFFLPFLKKINKKGH